MLAIAHADTRWRAYVLLAPALICLLVFGFWPVLCGIALAFTDYSLVRETHFVGWANFRYLFSNEMFVTGLRNSLMYLLIVPVMQILALALAVLVNTHVPGIRLFRTAIYTPVITSVSVVGVMWTYMFHEQGPLNYLLLQLHLIAQPVAWLSDDMLAMLAVMFVTVWRGLGWYMVMYLAALQSVSPDVLEAAMLDGANAWQRFWRMTVPMLRPTILLCSVMSTLAALKAYQEVDVLTQGGPMNSTFTTLYYVYDQGLKHLKLSRGLAASVVVSVICMALAWIVMRLGARQSGSEHGR